MCVATIKLRHDDTQARMPRLAVMETMTGGCDHSHWVVVLCHVSHDLHQHTMHAIWTPLKSVALSQPSSRRRQTADGPHLTCVALTAARRANNHAVTTTRNTRLSRRELPVETTARPHGHTWRGMHTRVEKLRAKWKRCGVAS
jgi:hypothetical protein